MKYILRLLSLPFFIGLILISQLFQLCLKSYLRVKYGGEAVNYNDKMNRKTITDVFYGVKALSANFENIN